MNGVSEKKNQLRPEHGSGSISDYITYLVKDGLLTKQDTKKIQYDRGLQLSTHIEDTMFSSKMDLGIKKVEGSLDLEKIFKIDYGLSISLHLFGKRAGIYQDKAGMYRHRENTTLPGVWISKEEALERLDAAEAESRAENRKLGRKYLLNYKF